MKYYLCYKGVIQAPEYETEQDAIDLITGRTGLMWYECQQIGYSVIKLTSTPHDPTRKKISQ